MPDKDTTLRPRLAQAATKLRAINEPDLADAIDDVLAPTGWGRLRRSDPSASGSGSAGALDRNMAMGMPIEWREQIKDRARAKGHQLADIVNEGLQKYLDGSFVPVLLERSRRGAAPEKGNLNVRARDALREAVQQQEGSPGAAAVAASYLMSVYRVGPYAPKAAKKK